MDFIKFLNGFGYDAYIVGGYPRDKYLGITSNDIDICTNAGEDILKKYSISSSFGSFIVVYNDCEYQVTKFRKDEYSGSRYPKIEYVNTLGEDLKRRDFIMNTLCINALGNYVDYFGARHDIDAKIIRAVKDPVILIKEDPLRIIRALRFSSDLKFSIEDSLNKAIINNKDLLDSISKARIKKEINKVKEKEVFNNKLKALDLINYLK